MGVFFFFTSKGFQKNALVPCEDYKQQPKTLLIFVSMNHKPSNKEYLSKGQSGDHRNFAELVISLKCEAVMDRSSEEK